MWRFDSIIQALHILQIAPGGKIPKGPWRTVRASVMIIVIVVIRGGGKDMEDN